MNIVGRFAPLTFSASLFLGAIAASVLLLTQSDWKIKEQVELLGKQLATSLEISIADRLRAIKSLANEYNNTKTYDVDNLKQKTLALVKGMPGLVEVSLYDSHGQKIISATSPNDKEVITENAASSYEKNDLVNKYATSLYFSNQMPFLKVTYPITKDNENIKHVSGLINIESMVLAFTSDFEMSGTSFEINESHLSIYSVGNLNTDDFYSKSKALVAGRNWEILLQSESASVIPSIFIILVGGIAAFSSYIVLKKNSESEIKQQRLANLYRNAADASLDALFIFEALEVSGEVFFVLQSSNEISKSLMSGFSIAPGITKLDTLVEFVSCPRIFEMANQVYLNADSQSELCKVVIDGVSDSWFKIQIVKSDIGIAVTLHDVSKEHELTQVILQQAQRDSLTGTFNRQSLTEAIEEMLVSRENAFLCFMDLDRFKHINDNCGHIAGDELLKSVTYLLQSCLRRYDILARVGGDEFCILIKTGSVSQVEHILKRIIREFSEFRFSWGEHDFTIGASIGVVDLLNNSDLSCVDFIKIADAGCYIVKRTGGNGYFIVDKNSEQMKAIENERGTIQKIIDALNHDKFELYSQKILPIAGDDKVQIEILIRLPSGDGGFISPAFFIPLAERSGLMLDIDKWVVNRAIKLLSENHVYTGQIDKCAINISAISLSDPSFLTWLVNKISTTSFSSSKLCFEITETAAITNLQQAQQVIKELRNLGCKFSLDDFGVGMSSFGALRSLDVEYVKIDGLFIKNISKNDADINLVRSMVEIVHSMNKLVVAEFVSDQNSVDILRQLGVEYGQGYGLSMPEPWLLQIE